MTAIYVDTPPPRRPDGVVRDTGARAAFADTTAAAEQPAAPAAGRGSGRHRAPGRAWWLILVTLAGLGLDGAIVCWAVTR